MEIISAFDQFAFEYDQWFETHPLEYELELKAIRVLLPRQGRGLDIGAGSGRFTKPLDIPLGIEPSASMREMARKRGVDLIEGKAESLPIKNAALDYALLTTTLCFLEKPELAFKEVFRVLKSGGHIIIGLIDKNSKLGKQYEEKKSESKFYQTANFYSVQEVRDQLIGLGFENFDTVQALLPGDVCNNSEPLVKPGYGEGSFIVLRAQKPNA